MIKRRDIFGRRIAALALILCTVLTGCGAASADADEVVLQPREGVRVGCLMSEEYGFFAEQLKTMGTYLTTTEYLSGSIENVATDRGQDVWDAICTSPGSDRITFDKDAYYMYDQMSPEECEAAFCDDAPVDLMLVFGTAAAKWITANLDRINFDYFVFASADPISAGIVESRTKRPSPHCFAHVDPGRIRRQIEMAYEIAPFKSIGVVYEDSDAAYSYSGIRFLEELSEIDGFEIHRLHVNEPVDEADYDRYYTELKESYHTLIPSIDALYITTGMIEDEKLPWLLEEVHEKGVMTVAETSESQVEYGALMHITMSDATEEGQFAAQTLVDYMSGIPADQLNQVFQITPHISLNLETARKAQVRIPMSVYLIADEIYQDVKHGA